MRFVEVRHFILVCSVDLYQGLQPKAWHCHQDTMCQQFANLFSHRNLKRERRLRAGGQEFGYQHACHGVRGPTSVRSIFLLRSTPLSHHNFCANTSENQGKNPKFFSSGKITYLINTRLLTRGFYKKKFFSKKLFFFQSPNLAPNEILGFIQSKVFPKLFGTHWCDLFFFKLNSHTVFGHI